MNTYDPSQMISSEFGIFGIPSTRETSKVVLIPVPWEVTTSYGVGASNGPRIIRQASEQVDLFDFETGNAYKKGYFMEEIPASLMKKNKEMKVLAQELIELKANMSNDTRREDEILQTVNKACDEMSAWVYAQSKKVLDSGKLLGLVGGDHSTPFGAIKAVSEKHDGNFGILHIDAHADLRESYQGFTQSHASIMNNVVKKLKVNKLVQVGIRDFSQEEYEFGKENKIKTFFDIENKRRMLQGQSWHQIAEEIMNELPEKVYVSFDIDGLDPALCPQTGTPVPGGLTLDQVFYLFYLLAQKKKQIVGFDLNEVSSGASDEAEWDGNVGARVLYKLCGWSVVTN